MTQTLQNAITRTSLTCPCCHVPASTLLPPSSCKRHPAAFLPQTRCSNHVPATDDSTAAPRPHVLSTSTNPSLLLLLLPLLPLMFAHRHSSLLQWPSDCSGKAAGRCRCCWALSAWRCSQQSGHRHSKAGRQSGQHSRKVTCLMRDDGDGAAGETDTAGFCSSYTAQALHSSFFIEAQGCRNLELKASTASHPTL
jgi:hypothetical protein